MHMLNTSFAKNFKFNLKIVSNDQFIFDRKVLMRNMIRKVVKQGIICFSICKLGILTFAEGTISINKLIEVNYFI